MFPTKFKIKEQDLTELKVGKAMDEWTPEDKLRMEREDQEEIEANFPSYFGEFQRELYQVAQKKDTKVNEEYAQDFATKGLYADEIPVHDVF
jgi:hypothetical protein